MIAGWQKEISDGEHTGYITSVERTGLFYKTFKIHLKTDLQSSQEDTYCVVDPKIYSQLEQFSEQKTSVTISYFSWLMPSIKSCGWEKAVAFYAIRTQDIAKQEEDAKAAILLYEKDNPTNQKNVLDTTNAIREIKGRDATFFEVTQALRIE